MERFKYDIAGYNECFSCGKVEYFLNGDLGKCKFKMVAITIEMPSKKRIFYDYGIALCPPCFDVFNSHDF